jgi:quercetin dioxygenase-like cupin family protein
VKATSVLLLVATIQVGVPVAEEPRHKVVFTNRYVRVIDALLPVGDTTLFHTHDLDNVPVVITGGTIRTQVVAGSTSETTLEIGRAWFARGGYTHQIANIGDTPLRFIDAEILSRWNEPSPDSSPGVPQETTVVENENVRVARLRLDASEALAPHSHSRPMLLVEVSGSGGTASRPPGSFSWIDPGRRHETAETGGRLYDAVVIEWK